MIRNIVVGLLLLLFATALVAQPMRMTPQERTDRLAKELELTAEQKTKVLEVFSKQDQARQKAFEGAQGDRDAMRATMMKMREEANAKMKEILSPEQFAKYEKMMNEMRGGPGGPGGPPRRPN